MPPNAYQQYGAYRHIRPNTSTPATHFMALRRLGPNCAGLVYNATQSLATQHLGVSTNQSIHNTFQALTSNVSCVCLCRCTNMYIIHQIVITINSHQAYIIIPTQHLNIYIIHQTITKKWPLTVARKSLATAEYQAHCSDKLQHLGFPNSSQHVAVRIILAAASAPCLNQKNHKS